MSAVLFVGTFPPAPHGMAAATESLAARLGEAGLEVSSFNLMAGALSARTPRLAKGLRGLVAAWVCIRSRGCLFVGADAGLGQIAQLPAIWGARLRRSPCFVVHHSRAVAESPAFVARLAVRLAGRQVTHVVQCHELKHQIQASHSMDPSQVRVVSNGHCLTLRDVDATSHAPSGVVGHMSNLAVDKGFGTAGDVVLRLRERGFSVRLEVAGQPTDAASIAEQRRLERDLSSGVSFLGRIDGSRKREWLAALDLFVHPSVYEHECYAISVWEALAAGTPIVALEAGCLTQEAVGDGGRVLPRSASKSELMDAAAQILEAGPTARAAALAAAKAEVERTDVEVAALVAEIRRELAVRYQ